MKIERVKVSDLLPDPSNARLHSNKNLDAIKASLKKFSQVEALVVQRGTNVVIGGNGRLAAMKELGIEDTEVHYLDVDNTTAKALAIALNRTAETATWDLEVLGDTLQGLQEDSWDLGDLGFELDDLPEFMPDDESIGNAGLTDPDEIPEVTEPIAKRGQIWKLGEHRVMCGDSTSNDDVDRLMDGEKADMVFTDPPYNVNYESDKTGKIQNDNMTNQEFEEFIRRIYSNLDLFTNKNSSLYIAHATMIIEFDTVLREFDWNISNKIVWVKDIPTYGFARYKWQYEPIYFLVKGSPVFNGDKTQTNVWNFKSIQSAGNVDDNGDSWFKGGSKNLTLHPTQKPFQLVSKAVENSSNSGQLCLDLFLGSGSTLIACEKTGRRCFGMEISESYTDVIIKRWEDFTGSKAELING